MPTRLLLAGLIDRLTSSGWNTGKMPVAAAVVFLDGQPTDSPSITQPIRPTLVFRPFRSYRAGRGGTVVWAVVDGRGCIAAGR